MQQVSVLFLLVALSSAQAGDAHDVFKANPEDPSPASLPGLLYPRESESREVRSLDGMWDFALSPPDDTLKGLRDNWYQDKLSQSVKVTQMPVPSSYNDIATSRNLRDHVGAVWYDRDFFVPLSWSSQRVFVRFGSVNYLAQVWVNGALVATHKMGHLPFEAEITSQVLFGKKNRITVAVDNTLVKTGIPQGQVSKMSADNGSVSVQSYAFDFFNYAGIHRPVLLSTRPRVYVQDITIETSISGDTGVIEYSVEPAGTKDDEVLISTVTLRDANSTLVFEKPIEGLSGSLRIPKAKLWWPIGMSENPGYLYTLEVTLAVKNSNVTDIYRLPVGIRTVKWTDTTLLLNDKPVYFRGFGRHEDSVIRGRGLDLATMTRDHELLEWVGANAYRTSHYPYSDEVMDMADRRGFLIIDESPAVALENFSPDLLTMHKQSLSELVRRDKNRPSVIMWSIANEPRAQLSGAEAHFREIAKHMKTLDKTRPITAALNRAYTEDKSAQFLDIISFNRYNSWYLNAGRLDMIIDKVVKEGENWHKKFKKPVMMTEYGADTMPGLHELPEFIWSEEFETAVLSRHFQAFDRLRQQGWFIGEFIWNFADFRTNEKYHRVGGNKKGIFTRTRQPKMAAHHVRRRYYALASELDGVELPSDLEYYISNSKRHDEL